jgi:hypothetical protein
MRLFAHRLIVNMNMCALHVDSTPRTLQTTPRAPWNRIETSCHTFWLPVSITMCICLQEATRNWRQQLVRKHNGGCAANSTFAAARPHRFQSNAVDICSRARANGELPKAQYRGLGQVLAASAPVAAAQAGGAVECTPAAPQEDSEYAATDVSPTEAVASSAAATAQALKRALHAPIDLAEKRATLNSQAHTVGRPPSQQLRQADGVHLAVAAATRPSALAAAAAPRVAAQSVQQASLRAAAASRWGATASTSATPAPAWLPSGKPPRGKSLRWKPLKTQTWSM